VCSAAEVLDRVVASVGRVAITASDVEREYRFERFLDGQWPPPPPDPATLGHVRERLTYQVLLGQEEKPTSGDQAECEKIAGERLAALHKEFTRPEEFRTALEELGMTEPQVLARITQQELTLRLIDQRLRPAALPSDQEVADYYRGTFIPEFEKKNASAAVPPLSEVDGQVREVLTQKRINELLDQWIEELKPASRVRFYSF
jgi:hypothetical protein